MIVLKVERKLKQSISCPADEDILSCVFALKVLCLIFS